MDLYQILNNSDELIDNFCDILEELISKRVNLCPIKSEYYARSGK